MSDPGEINKAEIEEADLREKRLSESQPFELEMAFKQVLKDPQAKETVAATDGAVEPEVVKKDSNYENSINLFADIFYGVLVAPRQTMMILSDGKKYPANFNHLTQSIFFVALVLSLVGWLRFKLDLAAQTALSGLFFTISGLEIWLILAVVLYYLGHFARHKVRFGNALVSTAWAFLPFVFFAPILCFKGLLGSFVILLAMLPTFWFLYLLFVAYQSALKISALKMALILIVVPPVVVSVYLFWMGLAFASIGIQVLPRLLN